jgi:hypothetical protein
VHLDQRPAVLEEGALEGPFDPSSEAVAMALLSSAFALRSSRKAGSWCRV